MKCLLVLPALVLAQIALIKKTVQSGEAVDLLQAGVYSPSDGVGQQPSFINVTLSATKADEDEGDLYYALIASSDEIQEELANYQKLGLAGLCCVDCDKPASMLPEEAIVRPSYQELHGSRSIEEKAFYKVVFVNCGKQDLALTGNVIAHNPYGYVPGGQSGFILFYPCLSVVHLVLLLLWTVSLWWYRYSAVYIQKYCLSCILVICLLEDAFEAIDWSNYNITGMRSPMLLLSGLLFNAWQNTAARLLLLVVCMGWGVVKERLESSTKVVCLGVLYFFSHVSNSLVLQVAKQRSISLTVKLLTAIPVIILNVMIFAWIWHSLKQVQSGLQESRQSTKLQLFSTLKAIIAGSAIVACLWLGVEFYFFYFKDISEYWQFAWLFEVVWHMQFLIILTAVLWLWRPNERSHLLAFSEELASNDIEMGDESEITVRRLPS